MKRLAAAVPISHNLQMTSTMRNLTATICLTLALLLGSAGVSFAQDWEKGVEAYQQGDFATAAQWFRKSAERGDAMAQYSLGVMYDNGQGVTRDYKEAAQWYRKSAEQGVSQAQYNLGGMYYSGQGVIQDYKEAVAWFRKSAEQGVARAQFALGLMYVTGQGVLQDNVYAHMWWNIAALTGHADATKNRDIVAERMTAEDISKAQELARECVRKNYKGC